MAEQKELVKCARCEYTNTDFKSLFDHMLTCTAPDPKPITAEFFRWETGRWPEHDDLERVNCDKGGQVGHFHCGWCKHGRPMYECTDCATDQFIQAKLIAGSM
jgi:hypothetical protein